MTGVAAECADRFPVSQRRARLTWVPKAPRQAFPVLALQLFAAVALFAVLYWAEHTAPAA